MIAAPALSPRFSWDDYRRWPDGERWELIDGQPWAMAPAPSISHQTVAGRCYARLERHLNGKPCRPFIAPTDVKLSDFDVVQPDVLVVCDPTKVTQTHIEGAPELVIEVLSPHTAARDLRDKKALYERAGVREYLVIDPLEQYAVRFRRDDRGRFGEGAVIAAQEAVALATLEGFTLPLWELFDLPAPGEPQSPGPLG